MTGAGAKTGVAEGGVNKKDAKRKLGLINKKITELASAKQLGLALREFKRSPILLLLASSAIASPHPF